MKPLLLVLDGFGVYGTFLHYGFVIFFVGGAFLVFYYFWKKGKLDMDQEPAIQMMQEEMEDNLFRKENCDEK